MEFCVAPAVKRAGSKGGVILLSLSIMYEVRSTETIHTSGNVFNWVFVLQLLIPEKMCSSRCQEGNSSVNVQSTPKVALHLHWDVLLFRQDGVVQRHFVSVRILTESVNAHRMHPAGKKCTGKIAAILRQK